MIDVKIFNRAVALADWRRVVAEAYADVRRAKAPVDGWQRLLTVRNRLFKSHSQSPLSPEQRASFRALSYFPYNPAYRAVGRLDFDVEPEVFEVQLTEDGLFRYRRVARIDFELLGKSAELSLFWVLGYGGGLFLPFRDLTSRMETFGGGRYMYDTIKGADLGIKPPDGSEPPGGSILLDFNFAYNPSCAYNGQWVCPLSPRENDLAIAVGAGERRFGNNE
jgi:uncharacterized protein (DUF1684 family)